MRRVDKLMSYVQHDGIRLRTFQIAAPPVAVVVVAVGAFHENQQVRIDRLARHCRRARPPAASRTAQAASPTGAAALVIVRLVAQVHANDGRCCSIALRRAHPVVNPRALRILGGVPQPILLGAVAGFGAVIVEDDVQPDLACVRRRPCRESAREFNPCRSVINGAAAVVSS